ncbi:uncharacterized protein LOC133785212 [Humulus lupulus]|uniref:uncharacterized protein LOC133785212 n=1 Tax=Humulus lupulus TaxID=3486 RepID=UPI002B406E26|nr:uncharacterized protein LOC133785212 [Humulus lupulus]
MVIDDGKIWSDLRRKTVYSIREYLNRLDEFIKLDEAIEKVDQVGTSSTQNKNNCANSNQNQTNYGKGNKNNQNRGKRNKNSNSGHNNDNNQANTNDKPREYVPRFTT